MRDWKTLGYVPDSDEEDDDLLLQKPNLRDEAVNIHDRQAKALQHVQSEDIPLAKNATHQSVASQLEQALDQGLNLVRGVLSTVTSEDNVIDYEAEDSPLSSPPVSIDGSQPQVYPSNGTSQPAQRVQSPLRVIVKHVNIPKGQRTLRARAPIQEHPYALEDAKYRQLMKDRGLKPVNVPKVSENISRENLGEESQQTEEYYSSQLGDGLDLHVPSSPNSVVSRHTGSGSREREAGRQVEIEGHVEDELPDLTQLIQNRNYMMSKRVYKTKIRGLRLAGGSNSARHDFPSVADTRDIDHSMDYEDTHLLEFRVPPSPPHSDDISHSSEDDNITQINRTIDGSNTPGMLPTPLVSSDPKVRKRSVTIVSTSESSSSAEESDGESTTTPSAEEDDSQGLRWIRSKLRGILPPSFVKLDMQKQALDKAKGRRFQSSVASANDRGVARRTQQGSHRTTPRQLIGVSELLELESSDPEEFYHLSQTVDTEIVAEMPVSSFSINVDQNSVDQLREESEIDYMLPPRGIRRTANTSHTKKPRQQRIDDGWAVVSHRTAAEGVLAGLVGKDVHRTRRRGRRVTAVKRKKVNHRKSDRGVTVLDAPGFREMEKEMLPQFLKIAARQARTHFNQSHTDPSNKIFLLATHDDTKELHDQLNVWRERKRNDKERWVAAGADVYTQCTTPALDRPISTGLTQLQTTNARHYPSTAGVNKLKQSTKALLSRVAEQQLPSTTSNLIDTTNEGLYKRQNHLRSLFTHQNRSGQGQLLVRTPQPRTAQLEASRPPSRHLVQLPVRLVKKTAREYHVDRDWPEERTTDISSGGKLAPILHQQVNNAPQRHMNIVVRTKRPRKQTPKRSNIHIPELDRVDILVPENLAGSCEPETTGHSPYGKETSFMEHSTKWVQTGVDAIANLRVLPEHLRFSGNSMVGSGALEVLRATSEESPYNINERTAHALPIHSVVAGQSTLCHQYDENTWATIAAVLDGVYRVFSVSEPDSARSSDLVMPCVTAVESIVTYVQRSAYFRDGNQSALDNFIDFVQNISWWIENFIKTTRELENRLTRTLRSTVTLCLNSLAVLISHLQIIVPGKDVVLQSKLRDLREAVVQRIMGLVLEPDTLLSSLLRLQVISENATCAYIDPSTRFPEAESIVIIWQLCYLISNDSATALFCELVKTTLGASQAQSPLNQLGIGLMALCFILPLTYATTRGWTMDDPRTNEIDGAAFFNLIATWLQDLTTQVLSEQAPISAGQMLEAAEDLCLKMVKEWHWNPPPNIATALLRAYSWNAMLPFNTFPDQENIFGDLRCLSNNPQYLVGNDFFKFLKLTYLCIRALCGLENNTNELNTLPSSGKLRAFVFSMIPNNAQVLDARQEVKAAQFLALKNHLNLYITVFTGAPEGFQPRFTQLEQQVDLSTNHQSVCHMAIATWKTIALHCVQYSSSDLSNLQGVSNWMDSMLQQSIARFEVHHQFDGIALLEGLLSNLADVIRDCNNEQKARILVQGNVFDTICNFLIQTELHRNNDKIIIASLKVLYAYSATTLESSIQHSLINQVQLTLKIVVQQTLSNNNVRNGELLRHLMSAWFATAHTMVRAFHKHWNDFVEPHSNLSIDFLAGLRDTYAVFEAKECFYSDLIKADSSYYFLECRPMVFMTWIATLLLPVQSMRFEHILTNTILQHERESLMIKELALHLLQYDQNRTLTLQNVADSRIAILQHIIRNIFGQQNDPEDEWLAGGVDLNVQKELMRTMTKTMKTTWLSLKDQPAAQSDYTSLVHAIINEMETYPVQGFKIDPWFTGATEFPRPEQSLDNIFKCRFGEDHGPISKDIITNFRYQYTRALELEKDDMLVNDLIRVFVCVESLRSRRVDGTTQYLIDIPKQTKFVQIVFPAILERGFSDKSSFFFDPIFKLLIDLAQRVQFRIDNLNSDNMRQYVIMTSTMLCAIRIFVESDHLNHRSTAKLLQYTRLATSSIFALAEYGIEIEESALEACVSNLLGIYAVVQHRLETPNEPTNDLEFQIMTDSAGDPSTTVASRASEWVVDVIVNGTHDAWEDPPVRTVTTDLVSKGIEWALQFDATEPQLTEEEQELREYARREFRACRDFVVWEDTAQEEYEKEQEMWALVEELKSRDLICDEVEDWDW